MPFSDLHLKVLVARHTKAFRGISRHTHFYRLYICKYICNNVICTYICIFVYMHMHVVMYMRINFRQEDDNSAAAH